VATAVVFFLSRLTKLKIKDMHSMQVISLPFGFLAAKTNNGKYNLV